MKSDDAWFEDCDIILMLRHRPTGAEVSRMATGLEAKLAHGDAVNRRLAREVVAAMREHLAQPHTTPEPK